MGKRGPRLGAISALFADEIGAALTGALAIALVELIALGTVAPAVALPVLAMFLGLGLVAGLLMLASEKLVARFQLAPLPAALVRALPALMALVPLGRNLFEGAMAATLPGASTAAWWVPGVGLVGLTLAIWIGDRWLTGRRYLGELGRIIALQVALMLLIAVLEAGNRRLFKTEYPHIHLFLVIASCLTAAVISRVAARAGGRLLAPRPRLMVRGAAAALVLATLALALPRGLASESDRWVVATQGNHARHLARLYRGLLDRDDDGYAAVLGGGDCDDGDAGRNPGARDLPGNGRDEDCDGQDALPVDRTPDAAQVRTLADWLAGPQVTAVRERARGANLLFISVDALRADMLTGSGEDQAAFPNLSALLAESRRFDRAFAPASGTDVSLTCLVTARFDPFVPLPVTLLEAVQASGRTTHAIYPSEVLRWVPKTLLTRGLDDHDVVVNDRGAENIGRYTTAIETTERGLAFLAERGKAPDRPWFLWAHYFDVHEHKQVEERDAALREIAGGADLGSARGKYRALLALVDREVGRLIAELRGRGLWDRTVVVFFSDHGESLGEDPRLPDNHGLYLYNPLVHIPLAVRIPGLAPAASPAPVSLIDVGPTVLDLLGLPPLTGADAVTQLGHLADGAPAGIVDRKRPLVMNESDQWGVVVWPDKLMFRPGDNLVELYDLEVDFAERDNRAAGEAGRVGQLKATYAEFPRPSFDRSRKGRRWREQQARPPPSRSPPAP